MSGASLVNFEHIFHFILLLTLLNSNQQMPVGPEEWWFPTTIFFSNFEKYIALSTGKICWAAVYVFIFIRPA